MESGIIDRVGTSIHVFDGALWLLTPRCDVGWRRWSAEEVNNLHKMHIARVWNIDVQ